MKQKQLTLTKEQIKNIKFYLTEEVKKHERGSYDKFYLTSLELRANGDYFFAIKWALQEDTLELPEYCKGNLFNSWPVKAIHDGLDIAKLLLFPVHVKAQERLIKHAEKDLKRYVDDDKRITDYYIMNTEVDKSYSNHLDCNHYC